MHIKMFRQNNFFHDVHPKGTNKKICLWLNFQKFQNFEIFLQKIVPFGCTSWKNLFWQKILICIYFRLIKFYWAYSKKHMSLKFVKVGQNPPLFFEFGDFWPFSKIFLFDSDDMCLLVYVHYNFWNKTLCLYVFPQKKNFAWCAYNRHTQAKFVFSRISKKKLWNCVSLSLQKVCLMGAYHGS